ncbi:MAG: hypothetical protein ACJAR2_003783, partial [Ilumatobacter sp.]
KGTFTTKIEAPSDPVVLPIVLALIGAAVVVTVERVSTRVGEADASFPT